MPVLLYAIPAEHLLGVSTGATKLFGSILKDVTTGQIVGHVQQTGLLAPVLERSLSLAGGTLSTFTPLGVATTLVQNQRILSRLHDMQSTLSLLQAMQVGSLLLSGLGLGVSVATFAVMNARLSAIEGQLADMGDRIERVTRDRRDDDLRTLRHQVRDTVGQVETLRSRRDPRGVADRLQHALDDHAARLKSHFERVSAASDLGAEDLELLWTLLAAINLCHEAAARAHVLADELEAAAQESLRRAESLLVLGQTLAASDLVRRAAAEADPVRRSEVLRVAQPRARALLASLRGSIATIASQASLARSLLAQDIRGPDYLDALAQEAKEPILFLPTSGTAVGRAA